ncbi:hypothetical protein [Actinocatenispora comari]|uniref:Uncharacterized protein n=1 Tax=Actinocatenispora comari TaxID=2807577 RepID=A0A8J4A8E9_9ACTN|nr:hypothetical protein [Actinocatenispora comari]GIL26143.1 hypothetical protein NUM_13970 [Actinocatenispora comari]
MATHRDSGPAEAGASSYPGQGYHDVDYPSAAPGYSAGRDGERRYAERIPRYPDTPQPDGAEPTGRRAGGPEDLRLTDEDGVPSRPVESPTTAYQPVSPAAPQQQPSTTPRQAAGQQPASQHQPAQHQPAAHQAGPAGPSSAHQQQALGQQAPAAPPVPPQQPAAPQQSGVPQQPGAPQQPGVPPQPGVQPQSAPPAAVPQPNAALSDLLHEPTQLTEQVPVYPGGGTSAGTVHRAHAQLAWAFGSLAILFDIPIAVVLVRSLMSDGVVVGGVVSGLLLLPGLPLLAAGFYQLFSGRLGVRPGEGLAALSRRPVALLFAGVVLVLAGAMAAG